MAARAAWLGGGAAALLALAPGTADAQHLDRAHPTLDLGLTWWDGPKLSVGLGLRAGGDSAGGMFRAELLGLSGLRFTGGAFALRNLAFIQRAGIETGVTWLLPFDRKQSGPLGLHLAGGLDEDQIGFWGRLFVPVLNLSTGSLSTLDDVAGSLAVEVAPYAQADIGRPLRVDGQRVRPPAFTLGAVQGSSSRERALLTAEWLENARAEAASVPSFVRLAHELAAVGAPSQLVDGAFTSADDEVRHASLALETSERWTGARHALSHLTAAPRSAASRADALLRLAEESWLDGCLNEGLAAIEADTSARQMVHEDARAEHARVAADEGRHAELGWDVLAWAMREGPSSIRDRIVALSETPQGESALRSDEPALDHDWLARQGRLDHATRTTLADEHGARARKRLRRLVDSVTT